MRIAGIAYSPGGNAVKFGGRIKMGIYHGMGGVSMGLADEKPSPSGRGWGEGESLYAANPPINRQRRPPPSFRRKPESRTPVSPEVWRGRERRRKPPKAPLSQKGGWRDFPSPRITQRRIPPEASWRGLSPNQGVGLNSAFRGD